jgi:hypothetical protein
MKVLFLRILPVALLGVTAAALAQEGVATYKYTVQGESAAPRGESRVYFSPTAMRIEMQMNMSSGPNDARDRARAQAGGMPTTFKSTMIQKASEPDKLYTLNDERQTYSVMDLAEMRRQNPAPATTYTVKRTGSDSVAGLSCDKALVTSSTGSEIEVCVTNQIAAPTSSWIAAMNRQSRAGNWVKAMTDAGMKGFPIRMKIRSGEREGHEVMMELVSLEKKPVPGAMFAIPAGYKETSATGVNMSADQDKRMQEMLSKMTPEQRKAYEDAMKAKGKQ